MLSAINLRKLSLSILTIAAACMAANSARATDYHHRNYYWKTITVIETVRQPIVNWVIKYDHCGEPYRAKIVTYKVIHVPVQKQIKVSY